MDSSWYKLVDVWVHITPREFEITNGLNKQLQVYITLNIYKEKFHQHLYSMLLALKGVRHSSVWSEIDKSITFMNVFQVHATRWYNSPYRDLAWKWAQNSQDWSCHCLSVQSQSVSVRKDLFFALIMSLVLYIQ